MDLRLLTCVIIRKNGEYLVALPYSDTLMIRWSTSPYDAARLHRRSTAKKVADRVGGTVAEFNPLNGRVVL